MLKKFWVWMVLLFATVFSAANPISTQDQLKKLYQEKRYFELRDALAEIGTNSDPELLFYRGAIDNIFNRLSSSISHLRAYLDRVKMDDNNKAWIKSGYELLSDSYRKSFQYRQAAEINKKILDLFKNELSPEKMEDYRNEYAVWSVLQDVPPQVAEFQGDTHIKINRNRIPLTINGEEIELSYDTGADLSVLISSLADQFELQVFDVPIKIGTITGDIIDAQVGVASEMRIGNVILQNVLFLVVKDEYFYIPERKFQIKGVIGFPVLSAFREVTFTQSGEMIIPSEPKSEGEQNLALSGLKPVIEGSYQGKRLIFVLDTGASRSDLWPPFFKTFAEDIKADYTLRTEKFRGVGSQREVKAYIARDLVLTVAGKEAQFRRLPILIEHTTEDSYFFYGNIGLDWVRQFESMTLNFLSMSVVFE